MYINVLEMLEESAKRFPDRIAFKDAEHEVTYAEVIRQAKSIASFILKKGEYSNCPMAVCIDRNIESIILFLGIVYSGNFYVPLDVAMPQERISLILEDLQPKLIFSSKKYDIPYVLKVSATIPP